MKVILGTSTGSPFVFLKKFLIYLPLIITHDLELWSFGYNNNGQLCHGDTIERSKPKKTSFSNIVKISAGVDRSLFSKQQRRNFCMWI